jgi:hypothetical protein
MSRILYSILKERIKEHECGWSDTPRTSVTREPVNVVSSSMHWLPCRAAASRQGSLTIRTPTGPSSASHATSFSSPCSHLLTIQKLHPSSLLLVGFVWQESSRFTLLISDPFAVGWPRELRAEMPRANQRFCRCYHRELSDCSCSCCGGPSARPRRDPDAAADRISALHDDLLLQILARLRCAHAAAPARSRWTRLASVWA